jgi:thioesterase domain-containing protein
MVNVVSAESAAEEAAESARLCEVPFHRGGDKHPLYYVHEISGSVLPFAPIARKLRDTRTVIGLQSIGTHPGHPADRTIEEMAERFLGIVRRRAGAEPLELIGYSVGGLIAFEMAVRAAEAGIEVRLLGLIDAPAPGTPSGISAARVVRMIAHGFGLRAVAEAASEDAEKLLRLLVAEGRAAGLFPEDYTEEDLRPSVELQVTTGKAAEAYRSDRVFSGNVRLLGASGQLAAKTAAWEPFVGGAIQGVEVDAGHYDLLKSPGLSALTTVVSGWLADSQV